MEKLGTKPVDMYPTMAESKDKVEEINYPTVTLPNKLLGKDDDIGSEVVVKVKGKITRIEKSKHYNEFTIEATEGEIV